MGGWDVKFRPGEPWAQAGSSARGAACAKPWWFCPSPPSCECVPYIYCLSHFLSSYATGVEYREAKGSVWIWRNLLLLN